MPMLSLPDPLPAMVEVAVKEDLPPGDALYYWLLSNSKGYMMFKLGIKNLKPVLEVLVSKPEYLKKYGPDFVLYLYTLSEMG